MRKWEDPARTEEWERMKEQQHEHKWVFLRSSDTYETGYRRWAHRDIYFCEKCLEYNEVEIEHTERPRCYF